ncbi:MAG: ABC transporter substrate-binding protein [Chloroflexi bacterium]|nr:ABC transporter substrate-binding protein [Chloroflexota bacterium]
MTRGAGGIFFSISLLTVVALFGAACAPATAPGAASPPPGPTAATAPAASPISKPSVSTASPAEDKPKSGGKAVLAQHVDLLNADPLLCAATSCVLVVGFSFNKLLMRDKDNNVVADLAESWEQTDPVTYVVRLRRGVKFHDGQELKAEDVLHSVELLRDRTAHPTFYGVWHKFASVRALGDYAVEFKTIEPDPTFPNALSHFAQYIVPKKSYAKSGAFTQQWVGTGPFKLAGFTRNVSYRLIRNPTYFEKGIPYIDGIDVLVIPDLASRIAAFRTRRVDFVGELRTADLLSLRRAVADLRELKTPGGAIGMYFNDRQPPFNSMKLRQAVVGGLQRQELIDIVTQGTGTLSGPSSGVPRGWALVWFPEELKKLYAYDADRVKRLLSEAGYPDGFSFALKATPRQPSAVAAMEVVQQQLAKVRIQVKPEVLDFTTFIAQRDSRQFAAVSHIVSPEIEPAERLYVNFHSKNDRSYAADPEIDAALDEQYRILDPEKRRQKLLEAERMIIERGYAGVYFQQFDFAVAQPYLKNYTSPSISGQYLMRYAWLDK